jgi:hypothetical protein
MLAELRRIASMTGKTTVTKQDLVQNGRVSHSAVVRRFGSLRVALEKAGLTSARFMKATDDELLDILIELWVRALESNGRHPVREDLSRFGFSVSDDTFSRRFGSWRAALHRAAEKAERLEDTPDVIARSVEPVRITTRSGISIRKRFFVLKRDHYRCRLCGGSGVALEVDHIVPVARGGTDALPNLQTLCLACNRGKRDSLE